MKSIIDKNTGKFLFSTLSEVELQENEIAIDKLITENFVNPYFNFEKREFYEFATQNEIEEANRPEVPNTVSKRQLKQALVLANIPLENIDYAISQITDETERTLMNIFWNDSYEFERYHPKLIEFSQTLGMSEENADQIFILANTL